MELQLPQVIEIKGIRVLTSKQLAREYGASTQKIKQNFANNRKRFIEGKHYISFTGDDLRIFKNRVENIDLVDGRASHLYLWTEKGALLHAKSLNTDKAWEVYDYLVDFYFRKQETKIEPKTIQRNTPQEIVNKEKHDIAPEFRKIIAELPIEALDAMEKGFRENEGLAINSAIMSLLAEKMKRVVLK